MPPNKTTQDGFGWWKIKSAHLKRESIDVDLGASCFVRSLNLDAFLSHFSFSLSSPAAVDPADGPAAGQFGGQAATSWEEGEEAEEEEGRWLELLLSLPAELITKAFKLPTRRRDSQPRGVLAPAQAFSPCRAFSPRSKPATTTFPPCFFLNRSLFPPTRPVEVKTRVIIENVQDSCYTDYKEMATD